MGSRSASFYRCLAFARFWKVEFWRSFIKCQYFNDGWTDFHKIYISIYHYLVLFSKTGKTRVSHRVKMMTRWPWREKWPKWPGDPVPCQPNTGSLGPPECRVHAPSGILAQLVVVTNNQNTHANCVHCTQCGNRKKLRQQHTQFGQYDAVQPQYVVTL